jgi:molybdopterin-synthase adenylyltransferase
MKLNADEIERYARHIVLRDVGGPGQTKLKMLRILVIGAGGLGSPVLQYLAAAGVGELGIADDDHVSLSNLQRQTIFATSDVGRPKVEAAAAAVQALNPHVRVTKHAQRIDKSNAESVIRDYDVVLDGSDNFETRYTVSDACFYAERPLIMGAVGSFDASVTTLRPYEKSPEGVPYPTYRCLFPEPPAPGDVPACAEAGVLGALTGVVGSIMALEAIRIGVGFGDPLVGRILLIDGRDIRFETVTYAWDPNNPLNGAGVGSIRIEAK